jgi:hypothetical protein
MYARSKVTEERRVDDIAIVSVCIVSNARVVYLLSAIIVLYFALVFFTHINFTSGSVISGCPPRVLIFLLAATIKMKRSTSNIDNKVGK